MEASQNSRRDGRPRPSSEQSSPKRHWKEQSFRGCGKTQASHKQEPTALQLAEKVVGKLRKKLSQNREKSCRKIEKKLSKNRECIRRRGKAALQGRVSPAKSAGALAPERPGDCLASARQRQRRHVVVLRSHVHEVLHASQDALGKIFGRSRSRLQDALDPIQTKFHLLRLGLHHSA